MDDWHLIQLLISEGSTFTLLWPDFGVELLSFSPLVYFGDFLEGPIFLILLGHRIGAFGGAQLPWSHCAQGLAPIQLFLSPSFSQLSWTLWSRHGVGRQGCQDK